MNLVAKYFPFLLWWCMFIQHSSSRDHRLPSSQLEWLGEIQKYLTPDFFTYLSAMISSSGKSINQMGDIYACESTPNLTYLLLSLKLPTSPVARIGVWVPTPCSVEFSPIIEFLKSKVSGIEVGVEVSKKVENYPTGFWVAFIFVIVMVVFWVAGVFGNYTKVFGDAKLKAFFGWFDLMKNLQKIFYVTEGGEDDLKSLSGVRVLSICWIILGHSVGFAQNAPIENFLTAQELVFKSTTTSIFSGGLYAVDTFFFMSGFLTWYLITKKAYSKKGRINWALVYFHRYYRLFFPFAGTMFFTMYLFPYTADGPLFRQSVENFFEKWKTYWWTNLLFICNFVPEDFRNSCMSWVWYLANDFQFFVITPPIIYAYCKQRRIGYILCLFLIISSMVINGTLTLIYDVAIFWGGNEKHFDSANMMYGKPWSRMGPYFVGAIAGFGFFEYKLKEKYPELCNTMMVKFQKKVASSTLPFLLFPIGVALTALYVFPLRPFFIDWGQAGNWWPKVYPFLYNSTVRVFFVVGVYLVLLPTFFGRFWFVKSFLESEIFSVLARLNYMVYLIHILVIFWMVLDLRQGIYLNELNIWFLAIGTMVVSFIFAIPFTLLMEAPFLNLEKNIIFPVKREKKTKQKVDDEETSEFKKLIEKV
jgi:hypothetical protein